MATGNRKTEFYNKRNLSQVALDDHFFTYLDDKINDTTRAAYLQSGVLDDKEIGLTSSSNDTFSLDLTDAQRGVDDEGHIIDLGLLPTAEYEDIPFENATGSTYYVGFRYQEVANDVERNPRSSEPEYPWAKDTIGEKGDPDSVTDNTTYIRLVLNSLLESSVDHSGRAVQVYLKNPVSPDDSIAYYEGTVVYSSPNNYVDIPYTPSAGPLGQTAPTYPISTDSADYTVWVKGVSWFKNTDISTDDTYIFVGTITGNGPAATPVTFDTSGQRSVFIISLDGAYRASSTDTPAPGRTITVDKYAVVFEQSATSNKQEDDRNTAFIVDKLGETIDGSAMVVDHGYSSDISYGYEVNRVLYNGTGIAATEPISLPTGTAQVNFTRPGRDLTELSDEYLESGNAFIVISGTGNDSVNGAYSVDTTGITTSQMTVTDLDGSTPSWPSALTGSATILMYFVRLGTPKLGSGASYTDECVHMLGVSRLANGLEVAMYDAPYDTSQTKWLQFNVYDDSDKNIITKWYTGRLRMLGGGSFIHPSRSDGGVVGSARFAVDLYNTDDLATAWQADDEDDAHGFDFRGNVFAAAAGTVPKQLAASNRVPYQDSAWGDFDDAGRSFSQVSSDTIQITGGTTANLPVHSGLTMSGSTAPEQRNTLLAEIEYSTPGSGDGLYWVYGATTGSPWQIKLKTLSGATPTLPSGSGDIRLYGGVFQGGLPGHFNSTSAAFGSGCSIVSCAPNSSHGMRVMYYSDDNSLSTANRNYGAIISNKDNLVFGARDGGIVYARALSTKGIEASNHGLTQYDQVRTSLVTAENLNVITSVTSNLVPSATGNDLGSTGARWDVLAEQVDIYGTVSDSQFSSAKTVTKYLNLMNAYPSGSWTETTTGSWTTSGSSQELWVPVVVPDGVTITQMTAYWYQAGSTATQMIIQFWRKSGHATSSAGSSLAIDSFGSDTNDSVSLSTVIDLTTYRYYLLVKSSGAAQVHELDNIVITYTVNKWLQAAIS